MAGPHRISRRALASTMVTSPLWGASGAFLPAQGQAQEDRWRAGDGLRIAGSISGPTTLDPALSRDIDVNYLLQHVFRGLMSLDEDLAPVPCLAETVDVLDGATRFRFVLREGLEFHDGRPVSASDVRGSLSRALDPAIAGGSAGALAGVTYLGDIVGADDVLAGRSATLSGVAVHGEREVEITLREPSPTFLMRLASVQTSIVDTEQAVMDAEWWRAPNGSGPFAVDQWLEGESISLRASRTWWEGVPAVESVTFWLGASAIEPLNLYQAGRVDLVGDVPSPQVALVRDPASGIAFGQLQESVLFATSFIALGNRSPPLDDLHVRRALQLAFPAVNYARGSFGETVSVATGLVPPGMLGATWEATVPEIDIEEARAELAVSRYGSAEAVPPILIYGADVEPVESLRMVVDEALGLDVQAVEVPFVELMAGLGERRFPAYTMYWGADYPDPESLIGMLFGSGSTDNYTGYANRELDGLLDLAQVQAGEARIATLQRANQLLVDDAAIIALYHPHGFTLTREGMDGVILTPMGIRGLETVREGN